VPDDPATTSSGDLREGAKLGRCRIERVLATGGMGTIYIAQHEALDKTVVVKVLPPNLAADPEYQKRFLREARAAAKLEHPNIVQIYDAATESDMPYIVMQYIEGQDLQVLLDKKGRAPLGDSLSITKKVAQALAFAHKQGIIHRDIKPSNIMISKQGKVMVTDFGLARHISGTMSATVTQGGIVLGTPDYISPEQAMGERTDGRTDIYSLGCTIFRMIAGRPPYEDPNPVTVMMKHVRDTDQPPLLRKLVADVPEVVEKMVDKMLKKNPSERYQTMEEVVAAIDACKGKAGAGSRVETSPIAKTGASTAITPPLPKRTALIIAASAVGTLLFLIILGFLLRPSAATRLLNEAKGFEKRGDEWTSTALQAYHDIEKTYPGSTQADEAHRLAEALELRLATKKLDSADADYKTGKATFTAAAVKIHEARAVASLKARCDQLWQELSRAEVLARTARVCRLIMEAEETQPGPDRDKVFEKFEELLNPADLSRVGKIEIRRFFNFLLGRMKPGRVTFVSIEPKVDTLKLIVEDSRAELTLVVTTKNAQGEIKSAEAPTHWTHADDTWYFALKEK